MKTKLVILVLLAAVLLLPAFKPAADEGPAKNRLTYPVTETGQTKCFNNSNTIAAPKKGTAFYGQDAQYAGTAMQYKDNGDGTVTDLVTGLCWQKNPGKKMTWDEAMALPKTAVLAGHSDWRLPTIKELYSLISFAGTDPKIEAGSRQDLVPFINIDYFDFSYGDGNAGERIIDAQYWSSTRYTATTMNGNATAFGVNFADGRIKGYPVEKLGPPGHEHKMTAYVRLVRGNPDYGKNNFVDNGNGTITDLATGLMWMKADSRKGMNWEDGLAYAENLELAGYSDWRLPDAKELQSLVDYSFSPAVTGTAAIDPVFSTSAIINEAGRKDYPYFWSSTTHELQGGEGRFAVYLSFGEAGGFMQLPGKPGLQLYDVHGAGAQRCDLKSGDPALVPRGIGPQGDVMRINNYVRCVRTVKK